MQRLGCQCFQQLYRVLLATTFVASYLGSSWRFLRPSSIIAMIVHLVPMIRCFSVSQEFDITDPWTVHTAVCMVDTTGCISRR